MDVFYSSTFIKKIEIKKIIICKSIIATRLEIGHQKILITKPGYKKCIRFKK